MGRNYSAGFGIEEEEKSPSVNKEPTPIGGPIPTGGLQLNDPRILSSINDQVNATDAQKQVAALLGNSDAQAKINGRNYAGTFSNLDSDGKPPKPEEKPWYETGNMPSDVNPMAMNALSQLSEQRTAQSNPYDQKIGEMTDALHNQLVQQKTYELAHQDRSSELQAKHDALEAQHKMNVEEHNKALNEHIFAKSLTPEIMYRQYLKYQTPTIETSQPEVNVGKAPLGGPATRNYATEYGATREEAEKVASMSKMQKENIPRQTSAFDVMAKEFPNMPLSRYENYPFILAGESGEEYLKEKNTPEHEAELAQEKSKAEEEKIKQNIEEKLIEHKAKAMFEYETTKAKKEESATLLREAKKELDAHNKFNPSDIKENIKQILQQKEIEKNIESLKNKFKVTKPGYDDYTNTFPMQRGGGDFNFARELIQNIANPNIKPEDKTYFIQVLNKLHKNNPLVLPAIQKYYSSQTP